MASLPAASVPAASLPWAELAGFALAIACSPLHIGLLLLLLLGPRPLRQGGWLVGAWLLTAWLELALLLGVGHGLVLDMTRGTSHRTGLDLLAAGGLLALGLKALLAGEADAATVWDRRLERLAALGMAPLIGLSTLLQVLTPDDLFLYAKAAASMLAADLGLGREWLVAGGFGLLTATLLLPPLLALGLLGQERVRPWLAGARRWITERGDRLVGGISLALAIVLGWQGIEGLAG